MLSDKNPIKLNNLIKSSQISPAPPFGVKKIFAVDVRSAIEAKFGTVPAGTYYMMIFAQNDQNQFLGGPSRMVRIILTDVPADTQFED